MNISTNGEVELRAARLAYAEAKAAVQTARDALQTALHRRLVAGVRVARLRGALRRAGLSEAL